MYDNKVLEEGRTLADYEISVFNTIDLQLVKTKVILDGNGGKFTDSEQYIINDYYTEEFIEPTKDGYTFKGWYTEKVGGKTIDYYIEDNEIESGMTFYAHWDKYGVVTVDFTNFVSANNWTDLENILLNFLYNKGLLGIEDNKLVDKDSKVLLIVDDNDNISLAEELSVSDNIIYTLTDEEKEKIKADNNRIINIPNVIEIIFVKENAYKVTFDANGGIFNDSDKFIIEKWNNEEYDTLIIPKKDRYTFKGYYTEKTGGTKFEMLLNESGIDSDMTFYAQWEETIGSGSESALVEIPNTFDGIGSSVIMGALSLIGLIGAIIYLKRNRKRAR